MNGSRDAITGAALIALCAVIFNATAALPPPGTQAGLGPASYPRALAVIIAALGGVLLVQGLIARLSGKDKKAAPLGPFVVKMAVFFVVMAAYILLLPQIGYLVSTVLFLFLAILLIAEKRSPRQLAMSVCFALVAAIGVYYLFGVFLSVPLIEGPVDEFFRYSFFERLGGG